MGDDKLGGFCRRFGGRMRHHVYDGFILLMADPCDNRHGKTRDGSAQPVGIKDEEICLRPSSPDQDHGIVYFAGVEDVDEALLHLFGIGFSLYNREVIINYKAIAETVIIQRMFEILEQPANCRKSPPQSVAALVSKVSDCSW